jgi:hypothetical protein
MFMSDLRIGLVLGLLISCFILGLGFVSAEETPAQTWFNDTLYNDSCVVLKSDQYSYMRLDNQPVFGQLKVINSCGKELKDVKVIFYGASGGKISLVKLDKVDGVKEVPVEVKKTDTTVTTHRVLADAVNANKLELKVETPVNVEGVIDLASVAIMTKVVDNLLQFHNPTRTGIRRVRNRTKRTINTRPNILQLRREYFD